MPTDKHQVNTTQMASSTALAERSDPVYRAADIGQLLVTWHPAIPALTPFKLMCLVYLTHAWLLGTCQRPLVCEPFESWVLGPVCRDLYDRTRHYRAQPVTAVAGAQPVDLDEEAKSALSTIVQHYGSWPAARLSGLAIASGTPWSQVMAANGGRIEPISNDLMALFYASQTLETLDRNARQTPHFQCGEG